MVSSQPTSQLPDLRSQIPALTQQLPVNSSISRIYITGAAGSGVSTLGANLASVLSFPVFDVDDYFWLPTNPRFTAKRPIDERVSLLKADLERAKMESGGWVLSGSMDNWGEAIMEDVEYVIFVYTETDVRMKRLSEREFKRFGERIKEGGDMYAGSVNFMAWAEKYDDPDSGVSRSRVRHEKWLSELRVPAVKLHGGEEKMVVLRKALESLGRDAKKETEEE